MNVSKRLLVLAAVSIYSFPAVSPFAQPPSHAAVLSDRLNKVELEQGPQLDFAPHRVLVRFKDDTPPGLKQSARDILGTGAKRKFRIIPGLERLDIGMNVPQAVAYLRRLSFVEYAEPDYVVQAVTTPSDVSFSQEWGLHNTGQTANGSTGTAGADINMPEAWDTTTGNGSSVIAVIDTGTQWNHPDLDNNIWSNPGEIPDNGIDDDGNGYVDDTRGWDFYDNDNNPMDSNGHGTHTAGTICAEGNNGQGVAGVLWDCQIMPLRFLGPNGGYTSDAVDAIDYAVANGAKLSSNSWGSYSFSLSLYNAVSNAASSGHVFVAAAGNDGYDNGGTPFYPASFNPANVISVAATNNRDNLAGWSNYGSTTVDVGAPGVNIYSTNKNSGYAFKSGTSMATPHVTGLVALVQEQHSSWSYQQVINQVLSTVRPLSALQGKTVSGGIINAEAALGDSQSSPPPEPEPETAPSMPENLQTSVNTTTGVVTLSWNDASDNESGFEVERQKKHKNGNRWVGTAMIGTVGTGVTSTTDAPGDGKFHYRVRAYNSSGSSSWTGWVNADVTSSGGGSDGGGRGKEKPCRGKKCTS